MFGLGKFGGAIMRIGKQAFSLAESTGLVDKAKDHAKQRAMAYVTNRVGKGNVDKLAALAQTQAVQYATKWAKGRPLSVHSRAALEGAG